MDPGEDIQELHAQLHGMLLVMTVMIDFMSPVARKSLAGRLKMMEDDMRAQNALAGTIETLRRFRALAEFEP